MNPEIKAQNVTVPRDVLATLVRLVQPVGVTNDEYLVIEVAEKALVEADGMAQRRAQYALVDEENRARSKRSLALSSKVRAALARQNLTYYSQESLYHSIGRRRESYIAGSVRPGGFVLRVVGYTLDDVAAALSREGFASRPVVVNGGTEILVPLEG